jgi:uncharacterized protein YkwD
MDGMLSDPRRWCTALSAALLLTLGACTAGAEDVPEMIADPESHADALVALTNEARTAEGLDALEDSECAENAARERAASLVGEEELDHAPLTPVIRACAPLTTAAENLVRSSRSAEEVVDAWLGSPGHRANVVDPALTEIGVACVEDRDELLCSQVFLGP